MEKFIVDQACIGQRLDLFLTTVQNKINRSSVRKQIDLGKVIVNDQVEFRPHYKVKNNDEVGINLISEKTSVVELKAEDIPIDIIYEDNDLLVVNKPAGMVIHPATGNFQGTLMNAVMFHYNQLSGVGNNIRSGLIHRIDKDTSGLVMIGKTNKGLWYYSKMFAERQIHKTYLAVVAGNISVKMLDGKLVVRNYLGRNPGNRKKYSAVVPTKGRIAETEFRLLDTISISGKQFSLVSAAPKTGRTHQIRVHLSELGYPIIGDVIYGTGNKYSRLMLHAWKLKVELLSGKIKEFVAPIPTDFNRFIGETI